MSNEKFDDVNHLVLNFYPDGYSIAVKLNEFPVFTSETILETAKIPYEETSLLDYIENEELPPLLVEMIDGSPKLSQYKIWHNGCLILEVRDKINQPEHDEATVNKYANQTQKNHVDNLISRWMIENDNCVDSSDSIKPKNSFFIMLKPTNLSMLNDVLSLTESNSWTNQDRLQLESQIVLHNSPSLLLEPDATEQLSEANSDQLGETKTCNAQTRSKKSLPYEKLLKGHKSKSLGFTSNKDNKYILNSKNHHDALPPELHLQQFLASKRVKLHCKSSLKSQVVRWKFWVGYWAAI